MPRYFFDVRIDQDVLPDPEGQDLRDADQAWEVAGTLAQNLMNTKFERAVNWMSSSIEVKDDRGEIVLEFPFVEAIPLSRKPL